MFSFAADGTASPADGLGAPSDAGHARGFRHLKENVNPPTAPTATLRPAMADVQPLRALHYDTVRGRSARRRRRPALRRDRRVPARGADRALAVQRGGRGPAARGGEPEGDRDPYAAAGELFESWQLQGALVRDAEPALWAHTQDYTGPDGVARTRRGFFCRVRIEDYGAGARAPARAHAPGPEGGPAAPDARDAREHLADLLALLRPRGRRLGGARAGDRAAAVGARSPTPTARSTACGACPTRRRSPRCRRPRGRRAADRRRPPPLRDDAARTPRRSAARASTATSSCAWSRWRIPG